MGRTPKEYALYRGDKFIDIGTATELAKKYHMNRGTLYKAIWGLRNHTIKENKNTLIIIALDEEE